MRLLLCKQYIEMTRCSQFNLRICVHICAISGFAMFPFINLYLISVLHLFALLCYYS